MSEDGPNDFRTMSPGFLNEETRDIGIDITSDIIYNVSSGPQNNYSGSRFNITSNFDGQAQFYKTDSLSLFN